MEAETRHRFGCGLAVLVIALATFEGLVIGWLYAGHEARSIAREVRRQDPHDPLDGLGIIGSAITLLGGAAGFITGLTISCAAFTQFPKDESVNNP
jgi:hypothetical protein